LMKKRWGGDGPTPPGRLVGGSTSKPGAWKAHGPAGDIYPGHAAEPRPAGLFQAAACPGYISPIAGLKQPSLRRMPCGTLGRRIIALAQSAELDPSSHRNAKDRTEREYVVTRPEGRCKDR